MTESITTLTRKDFQSDIEKRWCPGCGDYSIFNALTAAFPEMGVAKEKFALISGIGCSSRFPYYTSTFGFHTIHGRAPSVALGTKITNPELSVWVITGDGDALSIGGNHYIHAIRRNADINILVFNNEIYGLTKGQTSPTSPLGKKTATTPIGSLEHPLQALPLALASGATFVARVVDTNVKMMKEVFLEAAKHPGTAVIELLTNCIIFNDYAFQPFEDKDMRDDNVALVEHGKPIIFGKNRDKAIILDGFVPKVVQIDGINIKEENLFKYDAHCSDRTLAEIICKATPDGEKMPLPVGIFRQVESPIGSYEQAIHQQRRDYQAKKAPYNLDSLLKGKDSWVVE